ncbi:class I adenylate-forming enzyme family protein [Geomicrobium sp. JSM 1781026]|uniref:class I adenylate-forming enzyme family protein n=1 Tax=Geomicrobium sp. JSM 1781026 TaxID=3344580 RepID=UPI0035C00B4B
MDINYMIRHGLKHPQKTAVQVEDGERWTYAQLDEKANRYGNHLRSLGVKQGDRVGMLLTNSLEYIGLYFAIARIGAIAVRLNFRLTSQEYAYLFDDAGMHVLIFNDEFTCVVQGAGAKHIDHYLCLCADGEPVPSWSRSFSELEEGSCAPISTASIQSTDPVMLMYTSGTTGRPKGAVWSHDNTLWFSTIQALRWSLDGTETAMTTGPLYHVGAMEDLALPVLLKGGTVLISKSKGFSIERVMDVIDREQVSDIFLFPFMIYDLLQHPSLHTYELSSLRRIVTGGDPLVPWAIEQMDRVLPGAGVIQVYGLTEGTPIAVCLDAKVDRDKIHTVGPAMPLVEIKTVRDDGETCDIGEVGEIWIKSPVVSASYWNKPEATAATFADGWCKTGDLGIFDAAGYLEIAGRKKDMIRSGGENIYAKEIEDVIIRHEGVKDVAIIGIPDKKFIEAVCAVIVPSKSAPLQKEDILDLCTAQLARFKKPREIIFVDALPRTPSGKVQKYVLRDQYREGTIVE